MVPNATARTPEDLGVAYNPPPAFRDDLGPYRSPLIFDNGQEVQSARDWSIRRREILHDWHDVMGTWPRLIDRPRVETLGQYQLEGHLQERILLEVAPWTSMPGYLLSPSGKGPFPAVLVLYYEPESAIGLGREGVDFARQLVRRGFVTLSIGVDPRVIDTARDGLSLQPLSYLASIAANALTTIAALTTVDAKRIGVIGHSYGGKWAMFSACLDDRFACGVWSDPGIVFDESRPNVNYWDPWYLGFEPGRIRRAGLPTPQNPRTGAYARLVADGRDLHELLALMAPRPFLVSGGAEDPPERWRALNHVKAVNARLGFAKKVAMTNRPGHAPTAESNAQACAFLEFELQARR